MALSLLIGSLVVAPDTSQAKGALELYGDVAQVAIPTFAGITSIVKRDKDGVIQLAVGTTLTLGTVQGLKYAVDTERPDGTARSFPSGHTAAAFAGASYLHYRYGWKWGLPTYVAAAVVGYSRIEADKHYWYDVVAGAAIANIVAYVMTDTYDESVIIVPILDMRKHNFGVLARFAF